jgi:hypothetical protein
MDNSLTEDMDNSLTEEILSQACRDEKHIECSGVPLLNLELRHVSVVATHQEHEDLLDYFGS